MNISAFIVTFATIWWIVFYLILPLGLKILPVKRGQIESAPSNPRIGKKIIWATLISLLLTWGIVYLQDKKIIDLPQYFLNYKKSFINVPTKH